MRKTSAAPVVQMTKMYSPAAMPVHKWSWKSVRRITACVPSRRIVRGFLSDWPTDRDPESTRPHLQERSQRTLTGPWPACYNRIHGSVVHARGTRMAIDSPALPLEPLFDERYGTGARARAVRLLSQPCVSFASIAGVFGVTRECVRLWQRTLVPEAPTGRELQRLCRERR